MRLSVLASLVLAALAGAQALPARAAEDNGFVSFQSDNDFYLFIGSDKAVADSHCHIFNNAKHANNRAGADRDTISLVIQRHITGHYRGV